VGFFGFNFPHTSVAIFMLVEGMVVERGNQRKRENTAFGLRSNSLHVLLFIFFFVINNNEVLNTKTKHRQNRKITKLERVAELSFLCETVLLLYSKNAFSRRVYLTNGGRNAWQSPCCLPPSHIALS